MAYIPKNFVNLGQPTVDAGWLNNVDQMVNNALGGIPIAASILTALGGTTPAAGAFTSLSASSTVSGTGFSSYLASPPAIGGTTPNTGAFTTLTSNSTQVATYPQTLAEVSASITPVNYSYLPGNVLRYGTNTTPGTTDMSTALANALASNASVYIPSGTYLAGVVVPPTPGQVIYGDGPSSILKQKTTGSVFSWNTSGIVYPQPLPMIRDLTFDGTNGTAHTINTSGIGNITLESLYFNNVPTGASSVYVNGAAATYVHDVRLIDIRIYSSQAGFAGIEFGSLVSDSSITNLIMQGNFLVNYCIYLDVGALTIDITDSHPYNAAINILNAAGGNYDLRFTGNTFDNTNGIGDLVVLNGANNIIFVGNFFEAVASGKNALTLNNMNQVSMIGNIFEANTGSGYAVQETGISNYNVILGNQISTSADWTAPIFKILGANTVVANNPGYNPVGTSSGTTGLSGSTITNGSSPATWYISQSASFNANVHLTNSGGPSVGTITSASDQIVVNTGPGESFSVTWTTTQPNYVISIH